MVSSPQPYYNYMASIYPSNSTAATTTYAASSNSSTTSTTSSGTPILSSNGSPYGSPFAGGNLLQMLFGMLFGGLFPPSGNVGQGFPPFGGNGQTPFFPPSAPPLNNNQPLQKQDYWQALRFADNQIAYGELPTGTSNGTVTRQELTDALTRLNFNDHTPQRLMLATNRLLQNFTALDNRLIVVATCMLMLRRQGHLPG